MSSACDVPPDPSDPENLSEQDDHDDQDDQAQGEAADPEAAADEPAARSAKESRKLAQRAYVKASNTGEYDRFGYSIALSADGSTLAVGAPSEASAATGVGGNQDDESAPNAGAVYVFTRRGKTWRQTAYVKASNADADDYFGHSVALSADGSILAVGAPWQDHAGAVYVLARRGKTWRQTAFLKGTNTDPFDLFGHSVSLSADGSTLAVGALLEDSAATGVGGDPKDESAPDAGAAYVFERRGKTWRQAAYVKASNTGATDNFGHRVALSADGATLAVSAILEDSSATGIGGNQDDDATAESAGAVYVFARGDTTWCQQAYVKASNTGALHEFGSDLALSADGSTLAVGAFLESSAAIGVGGDANKDDASAPNAGAVYVLARSGTKWRHETYVKASNTGANDYFGVSVALSGDGSVLAVGASGEASVATGIDGNQKNDAAYVAGASYLFTRRGKTWGQEAYVKASNTGAGDFFGHSVALPYDGSILAVGAIGEASGATGIDGSQEYNSALDAGAVYVFEQRRR
jgi:hypothetical protein